MIIWKQPRARRVPDYGPMNATRWNYDDVDQHRPAVQDLGVPVRWFERRSTWVLIALIIVFIVVHFLRR